MASHRDFASLSSFVSEMASSSSLVIKTREFLGSTYADCFTGSDCIDWIVQRNQCTRAQALKLGNRLVQQGFISHCAEPLKPLIDGRFFYFFTNEVKQQKGELISHDIPTTTKELAQTMMSRDSGLVIKPRSYFLTVYPPCFVACEAVDWMLKHLALRDRQEGVELGKKLVNEGFIQHVKEPLHFQDRKIWFRFTKYVKLGDSVSVEAPAEEPVVCKPSDFEQLSILGEGGYGTVKLVLKKDDKRVYAMKVIDKSKIQSQSCIEHIYTEKKVLINDSPFLLHLYFSFQTASKLYLVTDFLPGGDLFYHLSKRTERGFHPLAVRFFTAELILALEHLHQCGVIYRDLKLENVLLDKHGHICLADFGLSKYLPGDEDRAHTMCGSQGYLAPEILQGKPYSYEVDWFSLGVMMYELISTNNPFLRSTFHETSQAILTSSVNFPRSYFSAPLEDLLEKLLQKDPTERFQSAAELKRHIWFKGINWDDLALKKVRPPFKFKPKHYDYEKGPLSSLSFDTSSVECDGREETFQDFDSAFPRV